MEIDIRQATLDVLAAWWDDQIAKNPTDYSVKAYKGIFVTRNQSGNYKTFYAFDGGKIVGQATLILRPSGLSGDKKFHGNGNAEINKLEVEPQYQGNGIAGKLIRRLENWSRANGVHTLTIGVEQSETRNREIYKHWGYTDFVGETVEAYEPAAKDGKSETIVVLWYAKSIGILDEN